MTKNTPVGTSECPIKNCTQTVDVYRYRGAAGDPKKRRFAGRLYCVCPVHARVENQEYLLEHMKWSDPKKDAENKSVDASPPVTTAPVAPVKQQAQFPVPPKASPVPIVQSSPPKKSEPWLPDFWPTRSKST